MRTLRPSRSPRFLLLLLQSVGISNIVSYRLGLGYACVFGWGSIEQTDASRAYSRNLSYKRLDFESCSFVHLVTS